MDTDIIHRDPSAANRGGFVVRGAADKSGKRAATILTCLTVIATALTGAPAQATIISDITGPGSQSWCSAVVGGLFLVRQEHVHPAGTGNVDSFLRIQHDEVEHGYNTDAKQPPLDDKAGLFTHALRLGNVPTVLIDNTVYLEFGLDANQNDKGPVSLNQVQIFQSDVDLGTNYAMVQEADALHDAVIGFSGLSPIFQVNDGQNTMGSLADNLEIKVGSANGSGQGDMYLYVPYALVDGSRPDSYITLYSHFGVPGQTLTNDGFEEWFVRKGVPAPVPEPSTLATLGMGVLGLLGWVWRRRR